MEKVEEMKVEGKVEAYVKEWRNESGGRGGSGGGGGGGYEVRRGDGLSVEHQRRRAMHT